MINTKLFLLIGTSSSLISGIASAQCVATQDCATLGYTETSCSGGNGVKCPFGNKWACFKSEAEIEAQFCDKYGFKLSCSGTGYSGAVSLSCNGKYNVCSCADGYEWKDGNCQKKVVINGPDGEVYRCEGKVVGVRAEGMGFYVAMKDLAPALWADTLNWCSAYSFCGDIKGTSATLDQFEIMYENKERINSLLTANGGTEMETSYWTNTTKVINNAYYYYSFDMSDGSQWGCTYSCEINNKYPARPILSAF